MIRTKKQDDATAAAWQVFICDGCGKEIEDWRAVCLLRDANRPPEDLAVHHVHQACAAAFEAASARPLRRYGLSAPEAAWFLPVLMPKPLQALPADRPVAVRSPLGERRLPAWIPENAPAL